MFARLFLTLVGLACASAAALIFLPVAVVFDPLLHAAWSEIPPDHWMDILASLLDADDPAEAARTVLQLVWLIGLLICVAPVTIIALIGGLGRATSGLLYAGLTGLLAAAMPWMLRAGRGLDRSAHMSPAEAHLTLIFFLTGAVAGVVYWLIAARGPRGSRGQGWLEPQARS